MIFILLDFSPPQQLPDTASSGTKSNSCPRAAATSLVQELSSGSWEVAGNNAKQYLKCILYMCVNSAGFSLRNFSRMISRGHIETSSVRQEPWSTLVTPKWHYGAQVSWWTPCWGPCDPIVAVGRMNSFFRLCQKKLYIHLNWSLFCEAFDLWLGRCFKTAISAHITSGSPGLSDLWL